ncbi:MAG: hypothetical protein QOH06_3664 [Acidobacteriota bacterium]|jgi:hypothetical protein|nr:hypothetical protein [Acidobacteriota bacterium]
MSLPAERGPQQPRAVREVLQATLFPDYVQTEPSVGFLARAFIVATLPHSRPSGNEAGDGEPHRPGRAVP